jgi:hypothetical protein
MTTSLGPRCLLLLGRRASPLIQYTVMFTGLPRCLEFERGRGCATTPYSVSFQARSAGVSIGPKHEQRRKKHGILF